jgi:pimeloyl-ACP methyl ester carboxylesterase
LKGEKREMQNEKKGCVTIALAFLVFSVIAIPLPVANAAGTITLSATSATPGTSITVSGAGFGATKAVGIGFGSELDVINGTMSVTGPFDVAIGPYTGFVSNFPIKPGTFRVSININRATTWSPASPDYGNGSLGDPLNISRNGTINYVTGQYTRFMNAPISSTNLIVHLVNYTRYQYNLTPASGVTTNSAGAFTANITVPNTSNGTYPITVIDSNGNIATSNLTVTGSARAYTEITNTLNGANYLVLLPSPITRWNRNLIVYCHGYSHTEPQPPLNPSGFEAFASAGAAVAMSSYGMGGYFISKAIDNTYLMTQYVKTTYNATGKIFLIGISQGGGVALQLAEKYPNLYNGVLDLAGSKDLKISYRTRIDQLSAQNDTELTAKLQALGASVPPYPFPSLAALQTFNIQQRDDMENATGGTPDTVPQAYEDISATYHANINVPVITVHSMGDPVNTYAQALAYQAAVTAAGKSTLYRLYPTNGTGHVDTTVTGQISARFLELVSWSEQLRPTLRASAFSNVTVMQGWTWYFFVHSAGGTGPYSYQWYEGTTLLTGQTSVVLPMTKNSPGVYNYYCKVTDSQGAAANTNTVTLTVTS